MEQNYFTSRGFIEIGKEIYVYENFLSEDELLHYNKIIDWLTLINGKNIMKKLCLKIK